MARKLLARVRVAGEDQMGTLVSSHARPNVARRLMPADFARSSVAGTGEFASEELHSVSTCRGTIAPQTQ